MSEEQNIDQQHLAWLNDMSMGSRQAFQRLYENSSGKLLAIATKLLGRKDLAEEVLQEVYIKVWHNPEGYHSERGSVMTWLISILRNQCIDQLRHSQVKQKYQHKMPEPADISPQLDLDMSASNEKLDECMRMLKGEQRNTIQLAFLYGYTHHEITRYLSAPLGSIKSWIRRGLEALKRCLKS